MTPVREVVDPSEALAHVTQRHAELLRLRGATEAGLERLRAEREELLGSGILTGSRIEQVETSIGDATAILDRVTVAVPALERELAEAKRTRQAAILAMLRDTLHDLDQEARAACLYVMDKRDSAARQREAYPAVRKAYALAMDLDQLTGVPPHQPAYDFGLFPYREKGPLPPEATPWRPLVAEYKALDA